MELQPATTRPAGMTQPARRAAIAELTLLTLLAVLAACSPTPGASAPLPDATGVRGTVSAGPTCPVERNPPDPACAPRLIAGAILVVTDAGGAEVARATSAEDGTFSIELVPGAYRLTAQPFEGLMGTPEPMDFDVVAGEPMTELQVSYDTGIR
jgi:hypothetical protein